MLTGHEGQVNSAEFRMDGARIVTASRDGSARVWGAAPWRLNDPRLPEVKGNFVMPEEERKARFFEWKRQ